MFRDKKDLVEIFNQTIKSEHKTIEYVQSSLRSASELYKHGGHVTMKYRDQLFRMHYDNRRKLAWEPTIPSTCEVLIDSQPLQTTKEGENLRSISGMYKKKLYGKYTSLSTSVNKYKNNDDIAIRNFIKGVLTTPPLFNLPLEAFSSRQALIDFIDGYKPGHGYRVDSITRFKHRDVKILVLQKSKETENLVRYIKNTFEEFDENSFYAMSYKFNTKR